MIEIFYRISNWWEQLDLKKYSNWLIHKLNHKLFLKNTKYMEGILVDLGCGKCNQDRFLKYIKKYIGVDWENSLHNPQANIFSNLNEKIDLPNNTVDTAFSSSVMEHLYNPWQFVQEVYRILKEDRYFIIQVPFQWWIHEAPYDFYRYTPYGLKNILEKNGFEIIEISPVGGFFSMIALKINYFSIRMFKLHKTLWKIWLILLIPFWTINQIIAPLLDELFDRNWELETSGFWVVARKKSDFI